MAKQRGIRGKDPENPKPSRRRIKLQPPPKEIKLTNHEQSVLDNIKRILEENLVETVALEISDINLKRFPQYVDELHPDQITVFRLSASQKSAYIKSGKLDDDFLDKLLLNPCQYQKIVPSEKNYKVEYDKTTTKMSYAKFRTLSESSESLPCDKFFHNFLSSTTTKKLYCANYNYSLMNSVNELLDLNKLTDWFDKTEPNPGISTEYLYIGLYNTVFSAHFEDWNIASLNILYKGKPKHWFSIKCSQRKIFDELCKEEYPDCWDEKNGRIIPKKVFPYLPKFLQKCKARGIIIYHTIQLPFDLVYLPPDCFHFGYNENLNIAGAVNVGTDFWFMEKYLEASDYLTHGEAITGLHLKIPKMELHLNYSISTIIRGEDKNLSNHLLIQFTSPQRAVRPCFMTVACDVSNFKSSGSKEIASSSVSLEFDLKSPKEVEIYLQLKIGKLMKIIIIKYNHEKITPNKMSTINKTHVIDFDSPTSADILPLLSVGAKLPGYIYKPIPTSTIVENHSVPVPSSIISSIPPVTTTTSIPPVTTTPSSSPVTTTTSSSPVTTTTSSSLSSSSRTSSSSSSSSNSKPSPPTSKGKPLTSRKMARIQQIEKLQNLKSLKFIRMGRVSNGRVLKKPHANPIPCKICNKEFGGLQKLEEHIRVHTGLKPFKCPHCKKSYIQKGTLNTHIEKSCPVVKEQALKKLK